MRTLLPLVLAIVTVQVSEPQAEASVSTNSPTAEARSVGRATPSRHRRVSLLRKVRRHRRPTATALRVHRAIRPKRIVRTPRIVPSTGSSTVLRATSTIPTTTRSTTGSRSGVFGGGVSGTLYSSGVGTSYTPSTSNGYPGMSGVGGSGGFSMSGAFAGLGRGPYTPAGPSASGSGAYGIRPAKNGVGYERVPVGPSAGMAGYPGVGGRPFPMSGMGMPGGSMGRPMTPGVGMGMSSMFGGGHGRIR